MQKSTVLKWSGRVAGALFVLAILALPFASVAKAETIITGDYAVVGPDEVIDDDLFISGQSVQIDGTVNGDVFAAGQEIVVNGTVNGNLFMAGQVLMNNGTVDGTIYAVGFSLDLGPAANVSGNVYMAGFSLETAQGGTVGRSLYSVGYQTILNGDVDRDVLFSGGAFRLNGSIGRNLKVEISESDGRANEGSQFYMPGDVEMIDPGYELGDQATVGGEIDYTITEYRNVSVEVDARPLASLHVANAIRTRVGELISLFIVGAVMLTVWPTQTKRFEDQMRERPLQSIGLGLLLAIVFPVALLLAIFLVILLAIFGGLITLGELAGTIIGFGGLAIGLAAALFGFVFWLASKAVFGHLVGEQLFERVSPRSLDSRWGALSALLVGVLVYEVLRAIPVLGAILAIFVILIGLGAVAAVLFSRNNKSQVVKRKARKTAR
ncbi:MAG: polymer-forming cytoskeletal protein [Anaerolineales bacterium]